MTEASAPVDFVRWPTPLATIWLWIAAIDLFLALAGILIGQFWAPALSGLIVGGILALVGITIAVLSALLSPRLRYDRVRQVLVRRGREHVVAGITSIGLLHISRGETEVRVELLWRDGHRELWSLDLVGRERRVEQWQALAELVAASPVTSIAIDGRDFGGRVSRNGALRLLEEQVTDARTRRLHPSSPVMAALTGGRRG